MAIRRFQNFALGALTAARLNELADAIMRLEARVDRAERDVEPVRARILAWITGDGNTAGLDGCAGGLAAVSYPFAQIFLKIGTYGDINDATCVKYDIPEDAIRSERGAFLLKFEEEPSLSAGDVVAADLAPMTLGGNAEDKQLVYVVTGSGMAGGMQLAKVTESLGEGKYKGEFVGAGTEVEFVNMYEVEDHYGATDASVECAVITPNPLPIDSIVWLQKAVGDSSPNARYPAGSWFTCISVAFNAECTCGTQEGLTDFSQMEAGGGRDADAAVGAIMLDRSLRTT
jgi:hypothetical protein